MKKLLIPILTLLLSVSAWSQRPSNERVKAMKVAYITEKLDLSSKEAQQFWPIYNTFDDITSKLRNNDLREIKKEIRNNTNTISDTQAEQLLQRLMTVENGLHEARVKLVKDLRQVISAEKIIRLKAAEDAFNKELLKRLRERRQQRRNKP